MATWSLRLRPVWRRAPTSGASSVTRRSMAVWTSSSPALKTKLPSASSASTWPRAASSAPALLVGEQPGPLEAEDMGPAAGDVVGRQTAVKRKAFREGKKFLGLLAPAKAALPERHRRSH